MRYGLLVVNSLLLCLILYRTTSWLYVNRQIAQLERQVKTYPTQSVLQIAYKPYQSSVLLELDYDIQKYKPVQVLETRTYNENRFVVVVKKVTCLTTNIQMIARFVRAFSAHINTIRLEKLTGRYALTAELLFYFESNRTYSKEH